MSVLPPLQIERIRLDDDRTILVVRDDLIPGGTKRRVLPETLRRYGGRHGRTYAYAGPAQGYAQVALAYAAADLGYRAAIFVPARRTLHPLTAEAEAQGAEIHAVPYGRLNVLRARAREWAATHDAVLLPLGFDTPHFVRSLARVADEIDLQPPEVWVAAGSGALSRACQLRWPDADHYAIEVGRGADCGDATVLTAPEPFDRPARLVPPYPSAVTYDAKVWQYVEPRAADGALVWNVGA